MKASRAPDPVRMDSPLEGALEDAELLLAFAAQSRRGLERSLIEGLGLAAEKVQAKLKAGGLVTSIERTEFWDAYDKLAVAMAPLSAHSIRWSIRLNGARFPFSLFTPTALMALLTIVVFGLCLVVQSFWVAGKELVEKADGLDGQRIEQTRLLSASRSNLQRAQARLVRIDGKLCELSAAQCPGADEVQRGAAPRRDAGGEPVIRLKAQREALTEEIDTLESTAQSQAASIRDLNERGKPLQELLQQWHERARALCDSAPFLTTLCPVDGRQAEERLKQLTGELQAEERRLREIERGAPGYADARPDGATAAARAPTAVAQTMRSIELRRLQRDAIARLRVEVTAADSNVQRKSTHEVRIILSNLAAYVIPLLMGLLGALAYILQSMTTQLREHTYVPMSTSGSVVRLCLGAIAGVFGGLLAPGSDAVLKGLPPLFVPFVFGYGIEILFSLLNRIVRSFTQGSESPAGKSA